MCKYIHVYLYIRFEYVLNILLDEIHANQMNLHYKNILKSILVKVTEKVTASYVLRHSKLIFELSKRLALAEG